jgi:tRNA-specific 2-thiouridylase
MKITVGMSGGVDSAVSAYLLKAQGHEVTGVFMHNWREESDGACTAADDYEDVRRVCDAIGIPYYTANFTKEYRERVFEVFVHEYRAGRTPNPDVLCNSEIKFNAFLDFALRTDADLLATGHYARTETRDGLAVLLRGLDANKDQSYFLCALDQAQLARAMFPLGEMQKADVRRIAMDAGLPNARKKDSTGICFIGERDFNAFISRHVPTAAGDMVDVDSGRAVGRHTGLSHYTIGQRKGIGLGGMGSGEAWFVARKDAQNNILYVCQGREHPALYKIGLVTEGFSWIAGQAPKAAFDCTAKFRYRQIDSPCCVSVEGGGVRVLFERAQRAITPGQYCVLYDGEACLGGGVIKRDLA